MMSNVRTLFLTGITGVLGREYLKTLLTDTEDKCFVLVRGKGMLDHWGRLRQILEPLTLSHHLGTRVHVLKGDVAYPGLGLNEQDLKVLTREVTHFFHMAALTTLNASEEDCLRTNLKGTEEALKLAKLFEKKGKLERFYYFSTAYVAGSKQTFCAKEDVLTKKPVFANFYESSKYAAETQVRSAMSEGLPATIFRPSIVVGNSVTGEVGEFNVIYPFIKMFAHGMLKQIPTRPENSFNIVPIDFVVRAAHFIAGCKESIGKTYHLVSLCPPTIGTFLKLRDEAYPEMSNVEIVDPDDFKKEKLDAMEQYVFEMMSPYMGYLNDSLTFDATNTLEILKDSGIEFPETGYDFLKTLCDYAIDRGYLVAS